MKQRFVCPWASEAEMCDSFMELASSFGWSVYPETSGHDIVLVATPRCKNFAAGTQIGVQAKLQANVEVLAQALPRDPRRPAAAAPHVHAILVPMATEEFRIVARRLDVKVLRSTKRNWSGATTISPDMGLLDPAQTWPLQLPTKPLWVPEVEVRMAAGTAGPKLLTPWKMAAIKLCLHGLAQGYLTTKDFDTHQVSMSRWIQKKWIKPGEFIKVGPKRLKMYHLVDANRPPHLLYPEVTAAVAAKRL